MRITSICLLAAALCAAVPAQAQWALDYNIMTPEVPAAKYRAPRHHRVTPPSVAQPAPDQMAPLKPQAKTNAPRRYPRGSSGLVTPTPLPPPLHYNPPPVQAIEPPQAKVPPSLYVPQTGLALPNMQTPGNGAGGSETFQDRALRCSQQAGVYGPNMTGDRNAYIGSCINQ